MMFASKALPDRFPYRVGKMRLAYPGTLGGEPTVEDPRPFDPCMNNEPNPILEGARHPSEDWREWLTALNNPREIFTYDADYYGEGDIRVCTPEMREHATRVFSRLARMKDVAR